MDDTRLVNVYHQCKEDLLKCFTANISKQEYSLCKMHKDWRSEYVLETFDYYKGIRFSEAISYFVKLVSFKYRGVYCDLIRVFSKFWCFLKNDLVWLESHNIVFVDDDDENDDEDDDEYYDDRVDFLSKKVCRHIFFMFMKDIKLLNVVRDVDSELIELVRDVDLFEMVPIGDMVGNLIKYSRWEYIGECVDLFKYHSYSFNANDYSEVQLSEMCLRGFFNSVFAHEKFPKLDYFSRKDILQRVSGDVPLGDVCDLIQKEDLDNKAKLDIDMWRCFDLLDQINVYKSSWSDIIYKN